MRDQHLTMSKQWLIVITLSNKTDALSSLVISSENQQVHKDKMWLLIHLPCTKFQRLWFDCNSEIVYPHFIIYFLSFCKWNISYICIC